MSVQPTWAPLSPETIDPVATLEMEAGDVRWSRAHFEKELSLPLSRFFVLQLAGNILGYGGYWKVGNEAQFTNLVVSPRERRQGRGLLLVEKLLADARSEGCHVVTLEVRSRNEAALALYRKAGFSLQGRRPKAYTDPTDDALLMEKHL